MTPIRSSLLALLALALVAASCGQHATVGFASGGGDGGSPDSSQSGDMDGGAPFSMALDWHQDPQSETLRCHYLKVPNDLAAEIGRIKVDFPTGSHHVHVYHSIDPSTADVPDHTEDCTAIDWTVWGLTVGVQTTPIDWSLPAGVTVPLVPHEQLMVQVHWLNTTPDPIDRTININLFPAAYSDQHLGVVFGVAKDTYMDPQQKKNIGNWAPIPSGVNITAMMGHFHARGTRYVVDLRKQGESSGQVIYQAADEQTFQFQRYDPPPVPTEGQGLAFECDYTNDSQGVLTWGANTDTQEHCNMAAYFYPAYPPLSHLYLSGQVASATLAPTEITPGVNAQGHVQLTEQAGQLGVLVNLLPSPPGMMTIPLTVQVPPWGWGADFTAQGTNPGSASIGVTTGPMNFVNAATCTGDPGTATCPLAPPITIPMVVQGLALSEVFYNPTGPSPDGLQWVEIANVSNVPIDLSGYSLGSGGPTYGMSRASLGTTVLPPDGCLVVGGPLNIPGADPAANVFTMAEQFTPSLFTADSPANGVALFNVPLGQPLPAGAAPIDAVVYGAANTNKLVGPDGTPATPVLGVPAGSSLERTTTWQAQPVPTPGICRVSHAP